MAFKKQATLGGSNRRKTYFWCAGDFGNGQKLFHYVTADGPLVVEVSGYFADDELETLCSPGDIIKVFQVAAIDDTRSIQDDIAAGLVDVSEHIVLQSDGSGLQISADLVNNTVTYTS